MPWLIAFNVLMYLGAATLFFAGYGILALICFVVAALLSLGLSGGKVDAFDIF